MTSSFQNAIGAEVPVKLTPAGAVPVTLSGESISVTVPAAVEITNDAGNAIPVSGPVTDTQLRATAVKTEPLGIPSVARQVAVTVASANKALTATVTRISIKARGCDMRFVVGTGAQTANASTSHFIENGERLDIAVPLSAQIAVIRDTAATVNGTLCITELV